MRNDIPQAGRLTPGNFGVFFSKVLGRLPRGFADDFEAMDNGKKCAAVILQIRSRIHDLCEIENIITGLQNILNVEFGITRRHIAGLFRWMALWQV